MNYRVVLLPRAVSDVDSILNWLTEASPHGAAAWHRRWLDVLAELEKSATVFGRAPESADHPVLIQQVLFKTRRGRPYRALFTVRADVVYVLHIRGSRQNTLKRNELRLPPE